MKSLIDHSKVLGYYLKSDGKSLTPRGLTSRRQSGLTSCQEYFFQMREELQLSEFLCIYQIAFINTNTAVKMGSGSGIAYTE